MLHVSELSATSMTLMWTLQSESSIPRSSLNVVISTRDNIGLRNYTLANISSSLSVISLSPMSTYIVSIYTINGICISKPTSIEAVILSAGICKILSLFLCYF